MTIMLFFPLFKVLTGTLHIQLNLVLGKQS